MFEGMNLKEKWSGHSDKSYPEIFNTVPPLKSALKPGQLSEDKLVQFFKDGYLILDSFFTQEELDPAKETVNKLVDDFAQKLYNAGKITNLYDQHGFADRLTLLEKEFPGANVIMHRNNSGSRVPEAFRDVWSNERLLNLAEQLLNTADIAGRPQWSLRCKTPNNEASIVPWHQDAAYQDKRAYNVLQITAWIPLISANAENGCMQAIKGGHKTGRVADHQCCHGDTWYVMMVEDEVKKKLECDIEKDCVTCPVPYGGLMIFNNLMPHRGLNNSSDIIRWSLDVRFQSADAPDCLFGLKQPVRMRSSVDPEYKIDWESFNAVDRQKQTADAIGTPFEEFDTTIQGLHMLHWEIVHSNKHTSPVNEKNFLDYVKFID